MSRPASPTHVRHSPLPSAQVSPPLRSALKSPRTSWSYPSSTAPKVSISNNSTAIDSESSSLIDAAPSESRLTEEDHTVEEGAGDGDGDRTVSQTSRPPLHSSASEPLSTVSSSSGSSAALASEALAKRLSLQNSRGTSYTRRVGFDTMEAAAVDPGTGGGTGVNYSFSVSAKSVGYAKERTSREFLVATDLNEYSVEALNWTIENLAEDGDELVVLRVIEPGSSSHTAWKASQEQAREEAGRILKSVMERNDDRTSISIIVEFAIGNIEETIHRMLDVYTPDSLIVGTRGRQPSIWKSAFMGSVSRYCVERSPVPVVVVRPERKVRASLEKRKTDPKRRSYVSLLQSPSQSRTSSPAPTNRATALLSPLSPSHHTREEEFPVGEEKKKNKDLKMSRFKTIS